MKIFYIKDEWKFCKIWDRYGDVFFFILLICINWWFEICIYLIILIDSLFFFRFVFVCLYMLDWYMKKFEDIWKVVLKC